MPHAIVWFWNIGIHDPAWVQGVAAVSVVFLSLATLVVLIKYAIDTNAQAKASKKSADAAETAANAALSQVRAMIDKERARISIKIFRLDTLNFRRLNVVMIEIENFGPTHALKVRTSGYVRPKIEGFETLDAEFDDLVFPNESILRSSSKPSEGKLMFNFPPEWVAKIETIEPLIVLEAAGYVEYEDVFGKPHKTGFSYFIDVNVSDTRGLPESEAVEIVNPLAQWRISDNPEDNYEN